MHLSEREQYILQCLLSAANSASERTGHKGSFAKKPKYDIWLTTEMMRSLLPFLDLYRVVVTDNRKAVGKMTGVDADIYSKEYLISFHEKVFDSNLKSLSEKVRLQMQRNITTI